MMLRNHKLWISSRPIAAACAIACVGFAFTGCAPTEPKVALHEPNYLYAHAMEIGQDMKLEQPFSDSQDLLNEWFGTLDDPKLPPLFEDDDYKEFLSLEKVKMAAGPSPATKEPGLTGLYRQQCASCHGESGQGRGPVAASQNPYPREFRHGWFKYKSSKRAAKPLKEDLKRTLVQGLADSQMPKFNNLSDQQLDALVQYVIYLSVRGEFERKLLYTAAFDLDEGARLYNVSLKNSTDESNTKLIKEQLSNATDALTEIVDSWIEAEERVDEFDEPDFPLFGSETEENKQELLNSIEKGKVLFQNDVAACAKCHGPQAKGDGPQSPDYDDWTKDWTAKIGIKPTDNEALLPLLARGGMKPQTLKPRNIVAGHFRGGRTPLDLYRRIRYGIPGATMPAAAMAASEGAVGLTKDDIWHLVNYVLSIAEVPQELPAAVAQGK